MRASDSGLELETSVVVPPSVLLVDSDAPSVKLARHVLESAGWVVRAAPSFEGAREILAQFLPHVVVTELAPPTQPYEIVTNLRLAVLDVPSVAVTSMNGPDTEFRALTAGCSGFIRKPIDIGTFSSQLLAYLGDDDDHRPPRR